jgi:hypothetical protein
LPPNSHAALSNPTIVDPTLVTDQKGMYVAQLIVNDGTVNSVPSQVMISDVNSPPVANAGTNQTITVGASVQLDGSHSTDVDGDALTYAWAILSVPSGSNATLSNATAVQPTFVADRVGTYILQLIVNDGIVDSSPATVMISTGDVPPVASPGPGQTVSVGTTVTLNGSASTDSDGLPLTSNGHGFDQRCASNCESRTESSGSRGNPGSTGWYRLDCINQSCVDIQVGHFVAANQWQCRAVECHGRETHVRPERCWTVCRATHRE